MKLYMNPRTCNCFHKNQIITCDDKRYVITAKKKACIDVVEYTFWRAVLTPILIVKDAVLKMTSNTACYVQHQTLSLLGKRTIAKRLKELHK